MTTQTHLRRRPAEFILGDLPPLLTYNGKGHAVSHAALVHFIAVHSEDQESPHNAVRTRMAVPNSCPHGTRRTGKARRNKGAK